MSIVNIPFNSVPLFILACEQAERKKQAQREIQSAQKLEIFSGSVGTEMQFSDGLVNSHIKLADYVIQIHDQI